MGPYKPAPDVRNSRKFKILSKNISEVSKQLAELSVQKKELYESQKIVCPTCHKSNKISDLVLIYHYRYNKSYSSYEDSSWNYTGDTSTSCPHCMGLYWLDTDWLSEFSHYFADYCGPYGSVKKKIRYYHRSHYHLGAYQAEGMYVDGEGFSSDRKSSSPITPLQIYENLRKNREQQEERRKQDIVENKPSKITSPISIKQKQQ